MPKRTLVISDLHLGVQRIGGTTLSSAAALREYGHRKHAELLQLAVTHDCGTVVINGDLTDSYAIPLSEALELYSVTDGFLSTNPSKVVVWSLGNHSLSKNSANLGTEQFIGAILGAKYPSRFKLVGAATSLTPEIYVIPHVANQDLFDLELERIPDDAKYVMLHCNLDNKFAGAADHSLNLSRDQAKDLKRKGHIVILGHEHQGRTMMGGAIIVVGNQFPTSVSDCLPSSAGQKDGVKNALILDGGAETFIETWAVGDAVGGYIAVDWTDLGDIDKAFEGFIRVGGKATVGQSSESLKAISKFRQESKAFVVTNAVKVDQIEGLESLEESIEDVRSVDVLEMLKEQLDPRQRAAVEALYETQEQP